jgi:hypothetical protein
MNFLVRSMASIGRPRGDIAFNSLSTAGALQITGTSLQVGPTPSGTPAIVTFNLVETLTGATNTPNQTNGFSVSEVMAIPVDTVVPTITGTAQVGQTLTASTGTWTNSPTSYAYQWISSAGGAIGGAIPGATASTYVPVTADIGNTAQSNLLHLSMETCGDGGRRGNRFHLCSSHGRCWPRIDGFRRRHELGRIERSRDECRDERRYSDNWRYGTPHYFRGRPGRANAHGRQRHLDEQPNERSYQWGEAKTVFSDASLSITGGTFQGKQTRLVIPAANLTSPGIVTGTIRVSFSLGAGNVKWIAAECVCRRVGHIRRGDCL